ADADRRTNGGQVGHQLKVVRTKRRIVEVMLDGPQHIETQIGGEARQAQFLIPDLLVGYVRPAIAGEHHLQADIHDVLRILLMPMISRSRPRGNGTGQRGHGQWSGTANRVARDDGAAVRAYCYPSNGGNRTWL